MVVVGCEPHVGHLVGQPRTFQSHQTVVLWRKLSTSRFVAITPGVRYGAVMARTAVEARYVVTVLTGDVAAYVRRIETKSATHFHHQDLELDHVSAFPGSTECGRTKLTVLARCFVEDRDEWHLDNALSAIQDAVWSIGRSRPEEHTSATSVYTEYE